MSNDCLAKVGRKSHPSRLAHCRWPQFAAGHGGMSHSKPTLIHDLVHKGAAQFGGVSLQVERCFKVQSKTVYKSPAPWSRRQKQLVNMILSNELKEGEAMFLQTFKIWVANRYQWSQRWSMASLLHPFLYPFWQRPYVRDWSNCSICMNLCQCTDSDRMACGLG